MFINAGHDDEETSASKISTNARKTSNAFSERKINRLEPFCVQFDLNELTFCKHSMFFLISTEYHEVYIILKLKYQGLRYRNKRFK